MLRQLTIVALCTLALTGCNRFSGWFSPSGGRAPETLEPKGGYPSIADERRALLPAIASARLEVIPEGRLLVVTANAPVKGWWNVELIPETPQPRGRYQPDEDGVLRLRLVGHPPLPGSADAAMPADPRVDSITAALSLPHAMLAGVTQIQVTAAANTVSLRR